MFVKNGLSGEHYNFKRCEYLLKSAMKLNNMYKVRLLNLINDIGHVFPMGTAIK